MTIPATEDDRKRDAQERLRRMAGSDEAYSALLHDATVMAFQSGWPLPESIHWIMGSESQYRSLTQTWPDEAVTP